MGSRLVRFSFTPGENQQLEAVIKMPEEKRSIIHGVVRDHKNKVVKDAVVKLFEAADPNGKSGLKPLTHAFTDDCGQFMFGPLVASKNYVVKVWINNAKIKELIIHPDELEYRKDDPEDTPLSDSSGRRRKNRNDAEFPPRDDEE